MNLKETCQMTDAEYEERQKARAEEIKGCSEALAILSSDDAHDTFTRTFNFVQVKKSLKVEDKRVNEAEKVLFTAAKDLKKEKADDIKQKDYCVEELNNNERAQELKARDIDGLDAKIADLTATIDKLAKEIAALQAEVAEMQKQLKRA